MPNTDDLNRTLFVADNLPILRGLDSESVDLIATDPPFNKGVKAFEGIVTAGAGREGRKVSYKDTWTWGDVQEDWTEAIKDDHPNLYAVIQAANVAAGEDMGAFLCWLGVRVLEMHRILKPAGSFYLHVDHTAHAYVKTMLDAIFGRANFRNEIVWAYRGGGVPKTDFARKHDSILRYGKSAVVTFNVDAVRIPYSEDSEDRLKYKARSFRGARTYDAYEPNPKGKHPEDWWVMQPIMPSSGERIGYPTQKPLALYERIIRASSNEGDMILDPFAGCATTCVAAERLGRQWIAIDINSEAESVMLRRLQREAAKIPLGSRSWKRAVHVRTRAPRRTDDGEKAAPELVLVSPRPRAPRYTARQLRETLVLSDGRKCQGCGWVPHHEEYLEVDHRVPRSRDGRDDLRNRVLLCGPCNGAKGNKLTLAELRFRRISENRMVDPSWNMAWYERTGRFG